MYVAEDKPDKNDGAKGVFPNEKRCGDLLQKAL